MFNTSYWLIVLFLVFIIGYKHNQLIEENPRKLLSPSSSIIQKFIISVVVSLVSMFSIYVIAPKLFLSFTTIGKISILIFTILNIFILFKFDSLLNYIRSNKISYNLLKKEEFLLVSWLIVVCVLSIFNWFREIETTYILKPYWLFVFIYLSLFALSGIILGILGQSLGDFIASFFSKQSFMTIFNPIIITLFIIILIWLITLAILIIPIA